MATWLGKVREALLKTHRRLETRRIQTRLLMVCASLEQKPAPADPVRAARRRAGLAGLREYALRGRFPKNAGFPGAMTPYIKDEAGTLCAVAHLIDRSGNRPLVEALARECNNIRVPQVVEGPFIDWLRDSGLTQEEAALIQQPYMPMEPHLSADLVAQVVAPAVPAGMGQFELSLLGLGACLTAWLAWHAYSASRRRLSAVVPADAPRVAAKEAERELQPV